MIIVLGYRSHRKHTLPEIVYAGLKGSEMRDAVMAALNSNPPFVRMEKLVNPRGAKIPFRGMRRQREEGRKARRATRPPAPPVPVLPPTDEPPSPTPAAGTIAPSPEATSPADTMRKRVPRSTGNKKK